MADFDDTPAQADIFFLDLERLPFAPLSACLSAQERTAANREKTPQGHQAYVKTRGALRFLLGALSGAPPEAFDIGQNAHGKPQLNGGGGNNTQFSLSRRGRYAAIALAKIPLGVDIEALDPAFDWSPVAETLFHAAEREALAAAPAEERRTLFFQLWTHKEAYLKGVGTGFLADPTFFATSPSGGPVLQEGNQITNLCWYTRTLDAPQGFCAAIASTAPDLCVRARTLLSLPGPGTVPGPEGPK